MMRRLFRAGLLTIAMLTGVCAVQNPTAAQVPDETLKALSLDKTASPKELYDALVKRYNDPSQGAGKGSLSGFWEPIPISKYLNPRDFYKPPESIDVDATREQCVECHTQATPGWVHSWHKSVHSNLEQIRKLPDTDARAYKKSLLTEVEQNLRSMGLLKESPSRRWHASTAIWALTKIMASTRPS